MTRNTVPSTPSNPADAPSAIVAAVCLSVFGIAFFNGSPVIVGAWSASGFTEQQAGWLASADNAGLVFASLLVAVLVRRVNRRHLAIAGITIGVAANLMATLEDSYATMLVLRFFTGIGGGVIYALGVAALAASTSTARNFSILLFVQVSMGIVEINGVPWLYSVAGLDAIYAALAAGLLLSGLPLAWLPARLSREEVYCGGTAGQLPQIWLWGCLVSVFFVYIAVGNFWTYIERVGHAEGLPELYITQVLTWTQLLSLLGCIFAAWISNRLGQLPPLTVSLIVAAFIMFSLSGPVSAAGFAIVLVLFFMVWSAIDIYQLGTLGRLDPSGRFPAMLPGFQGVSLALGPAIGALLLGSDGHFQTVFWVCGVCILIPLVFYILLLLRIRRLDAAISSGLSRGESFLHVPVKRTQGGVLL